MSKTIRSKIVGVSRENEDGISRQEIIESSKVGENLILERDPHNEFDENAIEVRNNFGEQLGFINKSLARDLAPIMDRGVYITCRILEITGWDQGTLGCNVELTITDKKINNQQVAPIEHQFTTRLHETSSIHNVYQSRAINEQFKKPKYGKISKLFYSKISIIFFITIYIVMSMSFLAINFPFGVGFSLFTILMYFMMRKHRKAMLNEKKEINKSM